MDISLFELVDIIEIEEYHKCNMIDIEVEEDHTFILSNGLISHNSAAGNGIKVRDPKKHGFFPLRGMPMNTFGAKHKDILDNKELSNIMAILGLRFDNDIYCITLDNGETVYATINDSVLINNKWVPVEELI